VQEGLDPDRAREAGDAVALSVIVIAQNDEATIAASIAAIAGQECPEPFETILVASGTDRTAAIVRDGFPAVTVIELPKPALPGEAHNAGLRVARGTYVTFPGSHVTIAPGSLQSRLRAHRRGYAMVTGVTENGTRTPAGWASYFLDHADGLPGQGPAELNGPPAHCSYARLPLLEAGGFPEGVRTAEDTAVNRVLAKRGYVALRDPRIRFVHHSPCRTWRRLARHHFGRGRGWGRLLVERHQESGRLLNVDVLRTRLVRHVPERLARVARGVEGATPELRVEYRQVRLGVVFGAVASWAGMWAEILRPAPGKWAVLTGRPRQTVLTVLTGEPARVYLTDIDRVADRVTTIELSPSLPLPQASGEAIPLAVLAMDEAMSPASLLAIIAGGLDIEGMAYIVANANWLPTRNDWQVNASLTTKVRTWSRVVRGQMNGDFASTLPIWSLAGIVKSIRASR
nr:glycosyltransferase [Chloroflexia bacterium]